MIPLAQSRGPNLACGLISLKFSSSNSAIKDIPSSSTLFPSLALGGMKIAGYTVPLNLLMVHSGSGSPFNKNWIIGKSDC